MNKILGLCPIFFSYEITLAHFIGFMILFFVLSINVLGFEAPGCWSFTLVTNQTMTWCNPQRHEPSLRTKDAQKQWIMPAICRNLWETSMGLFEFQIGACIINNIGLGEHQCQRRTQSMRSSHLFKVKAKLRLCRKLEWLVERRN